MKHKTHLNCLGQKQQGRAQEIPDPLSLSKSHVKRATNLSRLTGKELV